MSYKQAIDLHSKNNRSPIALAVMALIMPVLVGVCQIMPKPAGEPVYQQIQARLPLMKAVAVWKYQNGAPIENLTREAVVLKRSAHDAKQAGLVESSTHLFFTAQIDATKKIQACWHQRWDSEAAQTPVQTVDLDYTIRPQLIEIGTALIEDIRRALEADVVFDVDQASDFTETVQIDCLTDTARTALFDALSQVHLAQAVN